jgi:hypothetical protein
MLGHELTGHLPDERKQGREVNVKAGLWFLAKLFLLYMGIITASFFAGCITLVLAEDFLAKPFWAKTVWQWNQVIMQPLFGPMPDAVALFMAVVVGYVTLGFALAHLPTLSATPRHIQGRQGILTKDQAKRRLRR